MKAHSLPNTNRIESIDLLRGIVMVIMALDHVRDYFHADAFLYDPTDLTQTSVILFFTRWITHYCAPVFVFLAGTSAYLVGEKKGLVALSKFLVKRGLWLVFLELTVVNFAWFFNLHFNLVLLVVIWALGISMIVLAGLVYLPKKIILSIGLLLIVGHNLLDNIHVAGTGMNAVGWAVLHEFRFFAYDGFNLFVGYPLLAWIGVMALGYCFGFYYSSQVDYTIRKRMLIRIGIATIVLFVIIRLINIYGDPAPWSMQSSWVFTVLSFLNTSKYPPSLLYILMTLGPAILFLGLSEHVVGKFSRPFITVGRVPMFYYLLHLYFIHISAMIAAVATGYSSSSMVFDTWVTMSPNLKGYGFNLWIVYGVWITLVLLLFPLCKWYETYKSNHRENWWLSYL